MKTELQNRTLWFDGTNEVDSSIVRYLFLLGVQPDRIVVPTPNSEITRFNQLSDVEIATTKERNSSFDLTWNVPSNYLSIDVDSFLNDKLQDFLKSVPENKHASYSERLAREALEIKKLGMTDLLKTLIFVIDTFKREQVVWGVGRGSSCASLALYLIGLHKVDPVKYGIDMTEFFHD